LSFSSFLRILQGSLLVGIFLASLACLAPKQGAKVEDPPIIEEETAEAEADPIAEESDLGSTQPVISEAEPLELQDMEEAEPEILADLEADVSPQELLETALAACQQAQADWKAGKMIEALAQLDQAFEAILEIPDNDLDPVILQEKEDLRFLISKRIVEIYASQRTAVGDLKKSIPLVMNDEVKREIKSFQGRERRFFLESYKRSGRYRSMILSELRKKGLPEQLSWLPLIESGFKANALSRARALGLWQFIPSTGYRYGLERNSWVDERMDPQKATLGAIAYMEDLHNLFGDWMTALAAYNCGEGRVLRVINRQRLNYLDNFWDLYNQLPRETARYVPRFMATLHILGDPEKYGFELPEPDPSQDFSIIQVARSVSLADLDTMLDLPKGTMRALNPELRYKTTPDVAYPLRVPVGRESALENGIANLPKAKSPAAMAGVHVVRRGETLSTIASRYRTSVNRLMVANRLRNSHRIYPGQKLKLPGRGTSLASLRANESSQGGTWKTHRVRRGDSLWRLAKQYKTTVSHIKRWNNLNSDRLSLNQRLRVMPGGQGALSGKTYRVRRGDTLAKIAQRHGVSLSALLRANHLSKRDTIFPDQRLVIP